MIEMHKSFCFFVIICSVKMVKALSINEHTLKLIPSSLVTGEEFE